jgi:hypothetical protein
MPDWSALVRDRVGSLNRPRATEEEIVSELAAHLEDLYEEQIAGGMNEFEAFERVLDRASLTLGVVVPGVALLLGTLPFLKTANLGNGPAEAIHG